MDFWEDLCPRLEDSDFRSYFRMYPDSFRSLVKFLKPKRRVYRGGRVQLSPSKMVAMTLNYLGSQSTIKHLAYQFGVSPSTFCDATAYILGLVTSKADKVIKWHERDDYNIVAGFFNKRRRRNVPNVLGCIDGCHIRIAPRKDEKIAYFNYKRFHSIHLQAVCSYDRRFIDIFVGYPGRAHDARVWQQSPLHDKLAGYCCVDGRPMVESYHILGDSAYPLSNYLVTPYRILRGPDVVQKRKFNKHVCSLRSTVERSFGLLGLRFPRLLKLKCKSQERRIATVVSCCVFHNWCIMEDDQDAGAFEIIEDFELEGNIGIPADAILGRNVAAGTGTQKRDDLRNIISRML